MTTRALSITPDSADQPIPDLDIDALVGGAGSGTEKLAPKEVDSSNQNLEKVPAISEDSGEIERSRPRNKLLTQGRITITKPAKLSRHFSPPAMTSIFHHTDSKVAPPAVEASSQLPSLHRSGPTAETDNIDTPLRSGRAHSGPSTITYVSAYDSQPDPAMAPSSSSRLPYSSPLLTKDKRTPQPLEVQSNHLFGPRATNANIVDRLETLAWHETPRISPEGFEEESRKRQEITSLHGEKILERLTQPPKSKPDDSLCLRLSLCSRQKLRARTSQASAPRYPALRRYPRCLATHQTNVHVALKSSTTSGSRTDTKTLRGIRTMISTIIQLCAHHRQDGRPFRRSDLGQRFLPGSSQAQSSRTGSACL